MSRSAGSEDERLLGELQAHIDSLVAAAGAEDWDRVSELDRETVPRFQAAVEALGSSLDARILDRITAILAGREAVLERLRHLRDAAAGESQNVIRSRRGVRAYLDHH